MDASLFDLVGAYYENMSAKDIQKAGAHYLDPIWPVHPVIKYLLLFKALEKLHQEGKKNTRLRLMARATDKKAKAYMPVLIGELGALANQTPVETAQALIESCFCQTEAGAPYVFAHYLNGSKSAFYKAERLPKNALSRAVFIMNGCEGKIPLSGHFLAHLCVAATKHKYQEAAAYFMRKLVKVAPQEAPFFLTACGMDQKMLQEGFVACLTKKRESGNIKKNVQYLR